MATRRYSPRKRLPLKLVHATINARGVIETQPGTQPGTPSYDRLFWKRRGRSIQRKVFRDLKGQQGTSSPSTSSARLFTEGLWPVPRIPRVITSWSRSGLLIGINWSAGLCSGSCRYIIIVPRINISGRIYRSVTTSGSSVAAWYPRVQISRLSVYPLSGIWSWITFTWVYSRVTSSHRVLICNGLSVLVTPW